MSIKYPENYALGQSKVRAFPKKQYEKIKEIIDAVNDLSDRNLDVDTITPPSGTLTTDGNFDVTGTSTFEDAVTMESNMDVQGSMTVKDLTVDSAKTLFCDGLLKLSGTPQTLTGAGAVNTTTKVTLLVTTGANALTLAAPGAPADGFVKIITMKTDGGDGTLTPTGARGFSTITFTAVGQTATLIYKDSAWLILSVYGATVA